MAIIQATDKTFTEETATGLVLVDFWAPWCGPCKMIAHVLEDLDAEVGSSVKIVKVDTDENQETAAKFGIMSIPTLLVLKDGEIVDKTVGFQPKEALLALLTNICNLNEIDLSISFYFDLLLLTLIIKEKVNV